jgi:hypothetical protein
LREHTFVMHDYASVLYDTYTIYSHPQILTRIPLFGFGWKWKTPTPWVLYYGNYWTANPTPPTNIITMVCRLPHLRCKFDGFSCFVAWAAIQRGWLRDLSQGFILFDKITA